MKLLLICEREKVKNPLISALSPYDVEVIWYRDPIKAMDNLDETDPDAAILSASDFPRHWKAFLGFLKGTFPKAIPVLLLIDDTFDQEERLKADALGIQRVIHEGLADPQELGALVDGLQPPKKGEAGGPVPKEPYFEPGPNDRIQLLFLHPETLTLIEGKVTRIGKDTLWFDPLKKENTFYLSPPLLLKDCSLRLGDSLHTIDLELVENREQLVLRLLSIPPELKERF